ncbi:hypothetical protein [Pseudomonas huanghezhanensis]|uniref:hypothetical protein n=1 Tax=Pseudomonas huanghezhanensis TaxID=3002903 RepID=UPI002286B442|nr:hypothetical protein [Pseudomonas sp. BSw22131]
MSTLAEIAANLLKREPRAETLLSNTAALDAATWDELMPFASEEVMGNQASAMQAQIASPRRGLTVLQLINGGLA